jgi:hypothetical protein
MNMRKPYRDTQDLLAQDSLEAAKKITDQKVFAALLRMIRSSG